MIVTPSESEPPPCEYARGRHDFRVPLGNGKYRCSAPGCWAIGVPPWAADSDTLRPVNIGDAGAQGQST